MSIDPIKIKVCGVKSPHIAFAVGRLGVTYIGMVFHKGSKRNIELSRAKLVAQSAKRAGSIPVPVFVEQSAAQMLKICDELDTNIVQLHGDRVREQHMCLPRKIKKIYALTVGKDGSLANHNNEAFSQLNCERDYLLFDGHIPGSGKRIVTEKINAISGEFNYFVAGGLRENNVMQVISSCRPYAVDVSTGVENSHGVKDINKIEKFIFRIKNRRFL